MRRAFLLAGLLGLVALGSDKALTGTAIHNGRGDRWQFRLRLVAPEPIIQRDADHPESGAAVAIPTFDRLRTGAGAGPQVALPVKVVRVAIPEGAELSLESLRAPRRLLTGIGLGPDSPPGVGTPGGGDGPSTGPSPGDRTGALPEITDPPVEPLRLGQTGYVRFQRFVEVVYQPVRPVRTADGTYEFFPEVEADLVVSGVDWDRVEEEAASLRPDPHFEGEYRAAFVNYEEGRRFRTAAPRGPGRAPGTIADPALVAARTWSRSDLSDPGTAAPSLSPFDMTTTPVYRMVVQQDGIHRLSQAQIAASASGLLAVDPRTIKVLNRGVEVPIRIAGEGDGSFGASDFLEFYGQAMLGEADMVLNFDFDFLSPLIADIFQANDFTDRNVYFAFGTSEAGPRARIPDLPAAVDGGLTVESSFSETLRREFDLRHVADGLSDPYLQWPLLGGNTGSFSPSDPNAPNCGFTNPGVHTMAQRLGPGSDAGSVACAACSLGLVDLDPAAAASPATLRVILRGFVEEAANPDKMTTVQVGTTASQSSTLCWNGEAIVTQTLSVPQSALTGGGQVYIGQPGLSAATVEVVGLDAIEVDYRRLLRLSGGSLAARLTNQARTFNVGGFAAPGADDTVVYEISRTVGTSPVVSPRRITGGMASGPGGDVTLAFSLQPDGTLPPGAPRRAAAATPGGFHTPAVIEPVTGEDLTDTTLAADMIVITTPQVVGAPAEAAFTDYLSHRSSDSGLSIKVVMMQDIYDSFSFGIETPEALRAFLAYALDNWLGPTGDAAPPAYVMIVGDTSLDYKNNTGDSDWINQVPTFIMYRSDAILDYYSSDAFVAAFRGGDQLPDVHLGRVAVRSPAQTAVVFQKMRDYDDVALTTPSTSWRSKGLLLADEGKNPGETFLFETTQDEIADTYFGSPFTNERIYYADPNNGGGINQSAWRDDYVAAADAGAAVTSFFGHGAFDDWGNEGLFNGSHVPLMSATGRPTFLINENCLIGGFHGLGGDALSEVFLKTADKGAVAIFAPSGLSFAGVDLEINDALYPAMFGLEKERRFGHLMTRVRLALATFVVDLQHYTFLGDPAQRLTLPAPRPPADFAAVGGLNGQVVLNWTPGPDAGSRVRVYRTEAQAGGVYTLLNPSGATGTSYTDAAVVNGRYYFYRAVSVDPNGPFEGAVTSLNATCDLGDPENSGADCVRARPLNPFPPGTPARPTVRNPGVGDRLDISWAASPEPDLMQYTLHVGTTPGGPYPTALAFPAGTTSAPLTGLTAGTGYYMILRATNLSSLTSAPSPEASGLPSVFDGINPPDPIVDLDVRRSASFPSSIDLLWTPPATDVYGGPAALSSFTIYRDGVPGFTPGPANELVTIADPAAGTYLDLGAHSDPGNYYYLVGATDDRGFASGLGRQLPSGIADLDLSAGGGSIMFTWSQPSVDVDGNPTLVGHYELYADPLPVGRARTGSLAPALPFISSTTASLPIPPGSLQYYTVIVVDVRGNRSPF